MSLPFPPIPKKTTTYFDIIKADSLEKIKFYIQTNLERGWELSGGISQIEDNGKTVLIASMIYHHTELLKHW